MMFYGGFVTQNSLPTALIMAQERAMNMGTFHKVPNTLEMLKPVHTYYPVRKRNLNQKFGQR